MVEALRSLVSEPVSLLVRRTYNVDRIRDDLDDKWLVESCSLKVRGTVVEDEVDAAKLLQSLNTTACQEALADGSLEAVCV